MNGFISTSSSTARPTRSERTFFRLIFGFVIATIIIFLGITCAVLIAAVLFSFDLS